MTFRRRSFLPLLPSLPFWLRGSLPEAQGQPDPQKLIDDAFKSGQKRVTIPPGTYRITPPPGERTHLHFRKMSDFEVDATGVHLLLAVTAFTGIELSDSHHLQIQGFTLQHEVPPFTQGTVVALAPDLSSMDLQIDDGYPTDFSDPRSFPPALDGYVYDARTRRQKPNSNDLRCRVLQTLSPQRFRIFLKKGSSNPENPLAVGDLVAFRGAAALHCVTISNCSDLILKETTVHTPTAFGYLEVNGDGNNQYQSIQVRRGPRWATAKTDPLLSSTADGFHSINMRKGPRFQNCFFEGMGDDGIAIHGTYSLVLQVNGSSIAINRNTFKPEDPLLLFDPNDVPLGEAIVKVVKPLPDYHPQKVSPQTAGPYTGLVLDKPLPASLYCLCSNPAALGRGYEIRNTTIQHHRGRAMLLKAHNGAVEQNTIDGSSGSGIVLMPEPSWNEACYSQNVDIRTNQIRNVGYGPNPSGALIVAALDQKGPVPGEGHQKITIEGNTLEGINGVNLLITSSKDVQINGNHFDRPQQKAVAPGGAAWGERPDALIFISNAKNVTVKDNRVSAPGAAHKRLLQADSSVELGDSDWKPQA